jgi:hypothetical protein
VLPGRNQLNVYDLGFSYSPISFIGEGQPPAVAHVVIERCGRRELKQLDFSRLPVRPVAPGALQHPAAMTANQLQDLVLIGAEGVSRAGSRPEPVLPSPKRDRRGWVVLTGPPRQL